MVSSCLARGYLELQIVIDVLLVPFEAAAHCFLRFVCAVGWFPCFPCVLCPFPFAFIFFDFSSLLGPGGVEGQHC